MPRPDFIQAPTYWQSSAVYKLVCLCRKLVAGELGVILPADTAIDFREANGLCERLFQLPTANDNDFASLRAMRDALNQPGDLMALEDAARAALSKAKGASTAEADGGGSNDA